MKVDRLVEKLTTLLTIYKDYTLAVTSREIKDMELKADINATFLNFVAAFR